jgi:fatty-acyl-CoA synthase
MTLLEAKQATPRRGGKDSALQDWVRALAATAPIATKPRRLLLHAIEDIARSHGDTVALISARECLTYRELTERANRYARWALAQNLGKGEVVCLLMPNRPEYLAIWLGITSVGAVVALLNTNLRGASLAHCIDIVAPKHIVVAVELGDALRSAQMHLSAEPKIWSHGGQIWSHGGDNFADLGRDVEKFSGHGLTAMERRDVTIADRALYIYTSGTTGLPKAAKVSHHRLLQWSFWFAGLMNTGPADRMYDCLPMYHSIGGVVATGALLVHGGSVAIRDKFSAQQFWDDVVRWDCTLFQYIGELCRYLVNGTEREQRRHRLRLCCGNGLRADIWDKFQRKFDIPRILEFYAATEGNVSLYNVEGKIGAAGRVPPFLNHRFPLALVKVDAGTAIPARDGDGFCIRCANDEVGEAFGKIRDAGTDNAPYSGAEFEGYTDPEASQQKVIRNVFARGDAWYRTGDLMRRDANGFFYFVDRIGDTFRWKGENVATSEVAAAIAAFPGITEAVVYGVPVPGTEGAAGMAAVVVDEPLDLAEFRKHLAGCLPPYARPLFLRLKDRIAVTATFKPQRADLVRAGFDPTATDDALYFDDPARSAYVRLDAALFARIRDGKIRL